MDQDIAGLLFIYNMVLFVTKLFQFRGYWKKLSRFKYHKCYLYTWTNFFSVPRMSFFRFNSFIVGLKRINSIIGSKGEMT